MSATLTRRGILCAAVSAALTPGFAWAQDPASYEFYDPMLEGRDPSLLPPAESPIDYPIPEIPPKKIPAKFRRQMVNYQGSEWPGTIIVDPDNRFLYHVREGGRAMRYGVGVGR